MVDYDTIIPKKEEILEKLEPFLKDKLSLYGVYIKL